MTYQHSPSKVGGPCQRCGLTYSLKTSYVPCFETGDTFETWAARQNAEALALSSLANEEHLEAARRRENQAKPRGDKESKP